MIKRHIKEKDLKRCKKSTCSCNTCIEMCKKTFPCIGTPKDINKLIKLGYGNKLMLFEFYYFGEDVLTLCPAIHGYEGMHINKAPSERTCIMLENDRCIIHPLKPTEGKLVSCKTSDKKGQKIHNSILRLWNTKEGKDLIEEWKNEYCIDESLFEWGVGEWGVGK